MPAQYTAIKKALKKKRPKANSKDIKKRAAKIYIAKGKTKKTRSARAKRLQHG